MSWADQVEAEEEEAAGRDASRAATSRAAASRARSRTNTTTSRREAALVQTCCGTNVRLRTSADRGRMCELAEALGGVDTRLTAGQLADLKAGLRREFGGEYGLTLDVLAAAKLAVCRWPRPSEMKALFDDPRILRRRIQLQGVEGDGDRDPRVSHLIGRGGTTLQDITRRSGCVYIWIKAYRGRPVALAYGTSHEALARAARLMAKAAATWRPRGDSEPDAPLQVRIVAKPGYTAAAIDLKKMYAEVLEDDDS